MALRQKKQEHLQPRDPHDIGDAWIWRAMALPSPVRVVNHLSHDRGAKEATAFLAAFKVRPAGRPPLCTSDKWPAYLAALMANYRTPAPPPRRRGPGRPRKRPRRVLAPDWQYAQVDNHREGGRVGEVRRRIVVGSTEVITEILGDQPINTSSVQGDNLTSRQSHGRLVRKPLSHSKPDDYLQRHLDLEDAVCNCGRPHQALRVTLPRPIHGRKGNRGLPP